MKRLIKLIVIGLMLLTSSAVCFAAEPQVTSISYTYVNPVYKDIVTASGINENEISYNHSSRATAANRSQDSYVSYDEVINLLRSTMVNRTPSVSISFLYEGNSFYNSDINTMVEEATYGYSSSVTGDYLYYHMQSYDANGSMYRQGTGIVVSLDFRFKYTSTQAQENALSSEIRRIENSLGLSGVSKYEKVERIYSYITSTVSYDHASLSQAGANGYAANPVAWSAYGAAINKKAVCQGYSSLLYRLCFDAEIPVRIIAGRGYGEAHAWNIVRLGNYYYNMDVTWDAETPKDQWRYFLCGTQNFAGHYRDYEYDTNDFHREHPMSSTSYAVGGAEDSSVVVEEESPTVGYSGLRMDTDGIWRLYDNGRFCADYNDLYCDSNYGWWKVSNGMVDFGYTGLYFSPSCGWWLIGGGSVAFYYNDLWCDPVYGWWKVVNGTVDFGYTGLYDSPSCGWWLIGGGSVAFYYNDLWGDPVYGWWKVVNGTVDFGYTGYYNSPICGIWPISRGAVVFN